MRLERFDCYGVTSETPPPPAARLIYTPAGELVRGEGSGQAFAYDVEGKLRIADDGVTFRLIDYDPIGRLRRVGPDPGSSPGQVGRTLVHAGAQLMAEYEPGGALAKRHVFAPGLDEPLVTYAGSTRTWHVADPGSSPGQAKRGSVVAATDAAGMVTTSWGYGPHGEPDARGMAPSFGFTGALTLPQLGLTSMRARVYSHRLGRFLQPDPIGQEGGINLYDYAGGDPVNRWDPFGLGPIVTHGQTVAGCGTGCTPGVGGAFTLTASWRPGRSRTVLGGPTWTGYGGYSNPEWEYEQLYGDGKGSPTSEEPSPSLDDEQRLKLCKSYWHRVGEDLENLGKSVSYTGLGIAVRGKLGGAVTAKAGLLIAAGGGLTSTSGQFIQDMVFSDYANAGPRFFSNLFVGKLFVAFVPRPVRSEIGDAIFEQAVGETVSYVFNWVDPERCNP